MRRPSFLATALLLRRLTKSLDSVVAELHRIADLQEKRLKMDAVTRNFPLAMIDELEPTTTEDFRGEPDVGTQSDQDFAELEALEKVYFAIHGKPPGDEEDLIGLKRDLEDDKGPR